MISRNALQALLSWDIELGTGDRTIKLVALIDLEDGAETEDVIEALEQLDQLPMVA